MEICNNEFQCCVRCTNKIRASSFGKIGLRIVFFAEQKMKKHAMDNSHWHTHTHTIYSKCVFNSVWCCATLYVCESMLLCTNQWVFPLKINILYMLSCISQTQTRTHTQIFSPPSLCVLVAVAIAAALAVFLFSHAPVTLKCMRNGLCVCMARCVLGCVCI